MDKLTKIPPVGKHVIVNFCFKIFLECTFFLRCQCVVTLVILCFYFIGCLNFTYCFRKISKSLWTLDFWDISCKYVPLIYHLILLITHLAIVFKILWRQIFSFVCFHDVIFSGWHRKLNCSHAKVEEGHLLLWLTLIHTIIRIATEDVAWRNIRLTVSPISGI